MTARARRNPRPPSADQVESDLAAACAEFGLSRELTLSHEDRVLKAMRELTLELGRPPDLRQVADRASVPGGNMSGIIRRLHAQGLILPIPMRVGSVRSRWIPRHRG